MSRESDRINDMKAEVLKALAHPIRLALLEALRGHPRCVCELAEAVQAERSNVSRHLAVMVNAGILTSRKEGLMVYYSLKTPCVLEFLRCVQDVLKQRLRDESMLLRQL